MADLITSFYRQNEWANLALIEQCRPLTDEQLDATVEGTFGSIRDTWEHIVRAEGAYARQLGVEPETVLERGAGWPGWDTLTEAVKAAADALVEAARQDSETTVRVGSDRQYDVEASVVMIQAFHHGTDHRSQINTILTSLGFSPPEPSAWEWAEATDRITPV
jgi:uncharacterized damage-inducible protein DinB